MPRIERALVAAEVVLREFTPGKIAAEMKSGDDPVTKADLAVDARLREVLLGAGEGWLSEETSDDPGRLTCDPVWVVDPIDGTREFVEGIPEWCVSIGLVAGGEAVAGGIVNPATGEKILGAIGSGVRYQGPRPMREAPASLREASIVASRSEVRRGEWERFIADGLDITPMGSVAYKLALVGAGRADVTWTLVPKHEWDVAAGVAIVAAAGRMVVDRSGRPIGFNRPVPKLEGLIAADDRLIAEILAVTA
jgi:myo-inositol-1(or 4)-monophosphatase